MTFAPPQYTAMWAVRKLSSLALACMWTALLAGSQATAQTIHGLDLRVKGDFAHYAFGWHEGNVYTILWGETITLELRDAKGHEIRFENLNLVDPSKGSTGPQGTGFVDCTIHCTNSPTDYSVRGRCLGTPQQETVDLIIRILHVRLVNHSAPQDPVGSYKEICETHALAIQVVDYDQGLHWNHWCSFMDLDEISSREDPVGPSGWGGVLDPVSPYLVEDCDVLGTHQISARCWNTGSQYPMTIVVEGVDLKPDSREDGFFQMAAGALRFFTVYGPGYEEVTIYGLNQLDSTAPWELPHQQGVTGRLIFVDCDPGDYYIWGYNLESDTADFTVVRVSGVTLTQWEALDSAVAGQPPETPGGGKRILPDWPLADWDPDPDNKYALVQVRARVDPPPSDPNQPLKVRFYHYDVDDPSAAQAPVDSESGPDNRSTGAAAGHWLVGGSTTYLDVPVMPNGDVAAVFEAAKNPGDNHRVNAQVYVAGANYTCWAPQSVDDGRLYKLGTQQPPPAAEVTPLLTVWRRLHVECDTMAAFDGESDHADVVQGTIENADPEPVAVVQWRWNDHVTVLDRFVPGAIWDDQSKFGWVQANTAGDLFEVTHTSDDGFAPGDEAQLYDDDFDLENCDEWDPLPRANILPQTPDLSIAQNAYRKCYIEVDTGQPAWHTTVPFRPYMVEQLQGSELGAYVIRHTSRNNNGLGRPWFWIGYVQSAFQIDQYMSGDPDYLAVQGINRPADATWGGSAVFIESARDRDAQVGITKPLGTLYAHELTHSLKTVGGGHPEVVRTIKADPNNSNIRILIAGTLPVSGYIIESGCTVRISIPGIGLYDKPEIAEGKLSHWVNDPPNNQCTVYLSAPIRYEPNGRRNYYQPNDNFWIFSKSIMGKTEEANPIFCPAWVAKIRANTENPLP